VAERLSALGYATELTPISTRGDRSTRSGQALASLARQAPGLFVTEVEQALVAGDADVAVHSYKDLPLQLRPETTIAAVLARASAADVLMVHPARHAVSEPLQLRPGSTVGTSSPRRASLLAHFAPQAVLQELRGNVTTRLQSCADGKVDAVLLAVAGIERLGAAATATGPQLVAVALDPGWWQPAPAQGALAVQACSGSAAAGALAAFDHAATRTAVAIERGCLAARGGGCGSVLGAYAEPLAGGSGGGGEGGAEWRLHLGYADGVHWRAQVAHGAATTLQKQIAVWASGGAAPGNPV
jgi:hydroxymethylbilane synthase